ncbi:MAG: ATPase family associated with various cellular activities (AAA) [Methanomassiliicoccales archaeon PtaU1.Bin124]|nr:MAG: ATPase family associated with various cellular activities (AAA) [Methanomassiliicoccales archaeon PtaU1.Bin124]
MRLDDVRGTCNRIMEEVGGVIIGKQDVLEKVMLCILADGHLLFEDYPGLAKTLMAKSFAQALGLDFKRVQFTPDLLPADISGSYMLDRNTGHFNLNPGPVFCNILLADEINRAPPRTQAALLEAMQERQVTLEGVTHPLPRPFLVMATQNPIEYEGTYPLPEAQVDRFIMRTSVGYPGKMDEVLMLVKRKNRGTDDTSIKAVCDPSTVKDMQAAVEKVHVEDVIHEYIVSLVAATRKHTQVEVGASPRGSLALMKLSSARAALQGRDFVLPDDVKSLASAALAHRLILGADPWVRGVRPKSVIESVLRDIPVPKVE